MWKYIYNIAEPPSKAADIGEKIHKYILLLTLERFGMRVKGNYTVSAKRQDEVAAGAIVSADEDPMVRQCVGNYMKSDFFKEIQSDEMVLEQLFYWNLSGYILNCKIDRLELSGKGTIRIVDYKSSGSQDDSGHNDYANQLKAYTSGISTLYKTDCSKIRCCLFYLKDGAIKDYEFKKEDLSLFNSLITDSIRKINSGDFSKIKGTGKKFCSFCSYSGLCK
jgi:CRISPR/Cas system-associated exonuclease Cas4 (RecB family)